MLENVTFLIDGEGGLLNQSVSSGFVETINSIPDDFLKIEALDKNSLDIFKRYTEYHEDSKNMTGEENANVGTSIHPSHRNSKIYEGFEKMKSYNMLYNEISEIYGKDKADLAIKELISGSLAMHDSTNVDLPYCVAYSSSFLMKEGRSYVKDVPNVAPTNFRSYINVATESMFDACSIFMGATVIFDILIGMAYYTKIERDNRKHIFNKMKMGKEGIFSDEILLNIAALTYAPEISSTKKSVEKSMEEILNNCKTSEEVIDYVLNYHITNALQGWVHLAGNKFRQGNQSVFTNLNLFSPRVLKDNFDYYTYPNGDNIDNYIDEILLVQLLFAKFFSKGIKGNNFTKVVAMPVVTLMVPNDEEGAEELQEKDDLFINEVLSLFSKYNNINVYRGIKLAMCCRLVVEKTNRVTVNSLGVKTDNSSGNQAVGSLRVITIDPISIAHEAVKKNPENSKETFFNILNSKLDLATDILNAQRSIIAKRDEQGFFNLSQAGWVDLSKLASTFGGIGLYEAVKILNNGEWGTPYTEEDIEVGNMILSAYNQKCSDASEKYEVPFNLEFSVPGESMAFRVAKRNKINFGIDEVEYNEASNQFTPLTLDYGIINKLEWEEMLSTEVDPTGICHININTSLNPEQNVKMHRAIWKKYPHIQHYALNGTMSLCENGHLEMTEAYGSTCIVCGSKIIDKTTRSIGYFKSTYNDFGKNRQDEWKRRKWFTPKKVNEATE